MTLFQQFNHIAAQQPTYLTIGSFDGVHLGHQYLLKQMINAAHTHQARAAAITFYPHPRELFQPDSGRFYLAPISLRQQKLNALGLDFLITLPFNDAVRHTSATDFMTQLKQQFNLHQLWGYDFALGYQQEGDYQFLQNLGQQLNYTVHKLDQRLTSQDKPISSSRIRHHLTAGELHQANDCLGAPFTLIGTVVHGAQRGRTIGFPTANITVDDKQLIPANGVYATYAYHNGQRYPAATNIGYRPTVDGHSHTIEAHLLDFKGNLYDHSLTVEFIHYLRPEQKFDGLTTLINQITADVDQVRQQLT
ncbi:MAG TPA: bifunctional riboflavin kinase/FAD synthetase [Anaerolineae bacterium]|nr:bifunctional riboflavin kinase/FAD synthetase [Anaerolineae bacterium]